MSRLEQALCCPGHPPTKLLFQQSPTACLVCVQVKKSMCRIKAVMWERARALDNPADTARLKEFIDAL